MPDISKEPVSSQTDQSPSRTVIGGTDPVVGGMTILDYYAGQVLNGLLSSGVYSKHALSDSGVHKEIREIVWDLAMEVAANKPQ